MLKLYQGQVLFDNIYSLLRDMGFIYAGNLNQIIQPNNGRPIQADSIFLKLNTI